MELKVLDGMFCVCQVQDYTQVDCARPFCFTGATDEEYSLVCPDGAVPGNVLSCDYGWRLLRIAGTLDFSLVGILADISAVLAQAGIPIFALSTYNTDYVLVKDERLAAAVMALRQAGHSVDEGASCVPRIPEIVTCTDSVYDCARLAYIGERCFRETFADTNTQADMDAYCAAHFCAEVIAAELRTAGSTFLLALCGGEPVAYIKLNEEQAQTEPGNGQSLEIQRLYVAKKYKGMGIGSRLMERAVEHARAVHARSLWLGVWEHNDAALAFYRAKGFECFGQHDFVLGTDRQTDLLMRKLLP